MACGEYSTVALLGSGELYAWGWVAESNALEMEGPTNSGCRVDLVVYSML